MTRRIYNVLSLGAGVQSTALYLKFARGEMPVKLDAAIFADTQEEPAAVYRHLEWLRSLGGPPILVGTRGKLGEDLRNGRNSTGGRFASIPAFTKAEDGSIGAVRRQCSKEYKTDVIGKTVRREILGLAPGRAPKGVKVNQFIGISLDEAGRANRMERNVPAPKYIDRRFPLIEQNLTRQDCVTYNAQHVPHEVPRSACVFCPYHNDSEWDRQKREDPQGWARSVEIDHALRSDSILNRKINSELYLHSSCRPLDLVELNPKPPAHRSVQLALNFAPECEGVCGV
jgi:hypothetical protein